MNRFVVIGLVSFLSFLGLQFHVQGSTAGWIDRLKRSSTFRTPKLSPSVFSPKLRDFEKTLPPAVVREEWFGVKQFGKKGNYAADVVVGDQRNVFIAVNSYAGLHEFTESGVYLMKLDPFGELVWTKTVATGNFVSAAKMDRDAKGFIYLLVHTGPQNAAYGDMLVKKFDDDGNLVWEKKLHDGGQLRGRDLAVDRNGGFLYVVGSYYGEKNPPYQGWVAGRSDSFIIKMTQDGEIAFKKSLSEPNKNGLTAVTVGKDGRVIVAGEFEKNFFGQPAVGMNDGFVGGIDSDTGDLKLAMAFGSEAEDAVTGVIPGATNLSVVCGSSHGDLNGVSNDGSSYAGKWDAFILAAAISKSMIGGYKEDQAFDIATDKDDSMIVAGITMGMVGTGVKYDNDTTFDGFVIKYDKNMNKLWAEQIGTYNIAHDIAQAVTADSEGNVYVVGNANAKVSDDAIDVSGTSIFLVKYNPQGGKQPL